MPIRDGVAGSGDAPPRVHAWVADRADGLRRWCRLQNASADALERVIGWDWAGILCHDGFASYDRFEGAIHQQCSGPRVRRARDLLERADVRGRPVPAAGDRSCSPEGDPLRATGTCRGRGPINQLDAHRVSPPTTALLELVRRRAAVPEYATLAKHLWEPPRAVVRRSCSTRGDRVTRPTGGPSRRSALAVGEPQGVGRQPHGHGCSKAGRADVRVRDVPSPDALSRGPRQPDVALVRQPAPIAPAAVQAMNEFCRRRKVRRDFIGERIRLTRALITEVMPG